MISHPPHRAAIICGINIVILVTAGHTPSSNLAGSASIAPQGKRGEQFATAEMTCPTRTLCTTVRTVFPEVPVISVRTSAEIPKDKIFDVMREINRARVTRPMKRGEAVLPNVLGLGVDIIITSGLLEEKTEKENDHEQ